MAIARVLFVKALVGLEDFIRIDRIFLAMRLSITLSLRSNMGL